MMSWEFHYREKISRSGGIHSYLSRKADAYPDLFRLVRASVSPGGVVAEVGAGSGVMSCVLATKGLRCLASDVDPNMVSLIRENRDSLGLRIGLLCQDVRAPAVGVKALDAVFSNGLMEHFSDAEIVECLNEQLRAARSVIISIPSRGYVDADRLFGNERFMSKEKWADLVSRSHGKVVVAEEFREPASDPKGEGKWFLMMEIR